jgi:hypothetical protein
MAQFPKGHRSQAKELVDQCRDRDDFDVRLEYEIQTDKEQVKVVPCQFCKRPLIVTTFYVLAWAKCRACRGTQSADREPGSVEVVQAGGRTDPRLAKDLSKTLINPGFKLALCPAHPDDPDHVMELKNVHHNEHYGPHDWIIVDGKLARVQIQIGETALHQCVKCYATVTYSTTAVTQFKRQNEVGPLNVKHVNGWGQILGVREEVSDVD